MTNQKILEKALEKAIEKAVAGGWNFLEGRFTPKEYITGMIDEPNEWPSYQEIIFNHDFAKSLWGDKYQVKVYAEKKIKEGVNAMYSGTLPLWQYHLQQLVIAEDPIKYLGDNI